MFWLSLRTLRFRKGAFVASFVALVFGTMIVMACAGLLETGVRTAVPPVRLAAAPIVVTGNQDNGHYDYVERVRLPADLVARVAAVPGVAAAVPDVSFPAVPLNRGRPVPAGTQAGHGWQATTLSASHLTAGAAPAGDDEVVVGSDVARQAGLALGDRMSIAVSGAAASFRVVGVLDGPSVAGGLFFADAEAGRLLGRPGEIDSIGVLPAPGTDVGTLASRVEAAVAGQQAAVLTGDTRGQAEFPDALQGGTRLIPVATVSGGLATSVAMFVVAGTLGLSLQQRQREMALLRAIGTTPRQLRRMVLGEAGVVSGLAALVALVPGLYFGQWLFDRVISSGVAPPVIEYHQGWISALSAVAIMVVTALAAAFIAARRAATTRPTEALAEADLQRRWLSWIRLLFAVLCVGGGFALALITATVMPPEVAASTAGPSAMLWAAGLALLGPGLTRVIMAVVRWPVRAFSGLAGYLAVLNARSRRVRMAGAVSPIMLLTGLATALIYLQTTQTASADQAFTQNLRADAVLASSTGGLAPGLVDSVATLPGVGAASAYVPSTVYYQGPPQPHGNSKHPQYRLPNMRKFPMIGVTASGVAKTVSVPVSSGSLADLTGDTIALPVADAAAMGGRHLGETFTVHLGDGTAVPVRVVALLSPPTGQAVALLPASLVAPHTTNGLVPQILVRAAPGTDPGRLTATLGEFARQHVGVGVADRATVSAAHEASQQTSAWVTYLFAAIISGYAVLALINTLIIATLDRRREFVLQRLVGSSRGQVLRMMGVESVLVAIVGVVLGTVVSIATLVPFSLTATHSIVPTGPVGIYFLVVGAALLLTLGATLLPAWSVLPARLAGVLGTRE
jgi:putative ABC transport system permease protein